MKRDNVPFRRQSSQSPADRVPSPAEAILGREESQFPADLDRVTNLGQSDFFGGLPLYDFQQLLSKPTTLPLVVRPHSNGDDTFRLQPRIVFLDEAITTFEVQSGFRQSLGYPPQPFP